MRVLHIGKFHPPHPGGIERCSADLCLALSSHDVGVALLAHAEPGTHRHARRDHDGIDVTLAACHGLALHTPVSPGFPWLLQRTIRRFEPDLLHLHVPNPAAFWALLVPAARKLPWVVHWHADIPLDTRKRRLRLAYRFYRPWEQALLRRATAVIATSQAYLDSSAALAPWRAKTTVIPLGIAPAHTPSPPMLSGERVGVRGECQTDTVLLTDALPIASDGAEGRLRLWPATGLRILAVGRLSYFKGFDVLLRALAQLPDTSLVLIGDGECNAPLQRLASELGVAERVDFAGRIDMDAAGEATLAAAYASADVFCLPSTERAESFGLVLLEAMRARLPVIASAIPGSGVGFVVQDGKSGLMVAPGDVDALAKAVHLLAADSALRERLGDAGAARWREEFTLERMTGRVLQLYQSILRPPAVRAAATPTE